MARRHDLVFIQRTWTSGMGVVAKAHLTTSLRDIPVLEHTYDAWQSGLDPCD
jgi:hypothetical protein